MSELISVDNIISSPFQHRRAFDDASLRELAKSIEQDGLIQPITVRPVNDHYELIAGERRWRAVKQFTALPTIAAQVLVVNDLQARRLCATENIQRADLTPLEEIKALAELVDASLLLECGDEYEKLSPLQEPRWRVKMFLMKLESDRKNGTDYFSSKFTAKVKTIFDGLPKPKDWISFATNDLPLLFTNAEVQQFALDQKLNKSQTRAIDGLRGCAPETFKAITEATPEEAIKTIYALAAETEAVDESAPTAEVLEHLPDSVKQAEQEKAKNRLEKAQENAAEKIKADKIKDINDIPAETLRKAGKAAAKKEGPQQRDIKITKFIDPVPDQQVSDDELWETERLERENRLYYEQCREGHFFVLNHLIIGASIVCNETQVKSLLKYRGEWELFASRHHYKREDVLRTLDSFYQNFAAIREHVEKM